MALALLDRLTPWRRNRIETFLDGAGGAHVYMVHVGVGWALARLRRPVERHLARLDPVLRWLVVDGYGFNKCYFDPQRYVSRRELPRLAGYARRVFDQGLGRCLWFVKGADPARVLDTIAGFEATRHADLWSGVGLACAYAGGTDRAAMQAMRTGAGDSWRPLAQGAAFAAKARQRAGNPASHTTDACEILCGVSAQTAAAITDEALASAGHPIQEQVQPAYEAWRRRIQDRFTGPASPTKHTPVEAASEAASLVGGRGDDS